MDGSQGVRLPFRQRICDSARTFRANVQKRAASLLPPIKAPKNDSGLDQGDADAQLAMQMQAEEDESAGFEITQAWSAFTLTGHKGG